MAIVHIAPLAGLGPPALTLNDHPPVRCSIAVQKSHITSGRLACAL